MDQIDYQIIALLKNDGKLSNTELSNLLYISSQAIGKRRNKLEVDRVITSYSINSSAYKTAFIEIYMNGSNFSQFEEDIQSLDYLIELHKIAGSYCYLISFEQITSEFDDSLDKILKVIEKYGRYKVNISTKRI